MLIIWTSGLSVCLFVCLSYYENGKKSHGNQLELKSCEFFFMLKKMVFFKISTSLIASIIILILRKKNNKKIVSK